MNDLEKIEKAQSFREFLHKKLQLGQSRYVCRYGTLSESHHNILDSQRYFSAIREAWYLSLNMKSENALAKRAKAKILRSREALKNAIYEADELEARCDLELAETELLRHTTTYEDQSRQLDEYLKIEEELRESVDKKYPGGIEEASEDHWKSVAEFKSAMRQLGISQEMLNIPLRPELKAEIGYKTGNLDMANWYVLRNKDKIIEFKMTPEEFLELEFRPVQMLRNSK